jgi:hypothetical protein
MFMAGEIFTIYLECDQHGDPNLGGLALTRDHTLLNFQCNRQVVY